MKKMRLGDCCSALVIERSLVSSTLLLLALPFVHADCEPWCTEECATLNGDVSASTRERMHLISCVVSKALTNSRVPCQVVQECSGCSGDKFSCKPGAPGFEDWEQRRAVYVQAQGGVRLRNGETIPEAQPAMEDAEHPPPATARFVGRIPDEEAVPCQYIDAPSLEGLDTDSLARLFSRPTIIRGLIDHWPAHEMWANMSGFAATFGVHAVLSRRANFARNRAVQAREDPNVVTVPLADFEPHLLHEHIVIYDGEGGMADSEYRLLGTLRRSEAYDVPRVLMRAAGTQVFSFGGGHGVRMGNHGFAWIGLVAGVKHWYVAPGDIEKPSNPTCEPRERSAIQRIPGVTHCEQLAREVVVVPTAWWHATCNLEAYTFGVGGQDSCDLVDCPGYEDADHMNRRFCATGEEDSRRCFAGNDDGRGVLARNIELEQNAESSIR